MPELDECGQLLVTNPFADDTPNNIYDIPPTLTKSEHHPLRSRSVSPVRHCNTPGVPPVAVPGIEGETPGITPQLSLDGSSAEEDWTTGANVAPLGGNHTIIHRVGHNDSFAGVALRYGVSIAALRRANQLWPSDPIHLRTELMIPRGDTLRARHKLTRRLVTDANSRSAVEPPDLSPDLVASFVAARNMILSVLPARISLDSLSSKASASEDHELDDLQTARVRKIPVVEPPFAQVGHELAILAAPHPRHRLPASDVALSSQMSCSLATQDHTDPTQISFVGDLRSRSASSSPALSLRRPRTQPFAVVPVRTSQLEPEPAMELPVRRPRI